MIKEVQNSKGGDAITSDHWHVVHARFVGAGRKRPFTRGIESEHDSRGDCVKAAKALRLELAGAGRKLPESERDEVFVRPPGYKSLKQARRRPRAGA